MIVHPKIFAPSLLSIAAMLSLNACESSGSLRVASVGPQGQAGPAGPQGEQGATGATGSTGASGGLSLGSAGVLATGGLVGSGGVAGTGLLANTGDPANALPIVSGVLVSAGETVGSLGSTATRLVEVVDASTPGAIPLTGTVAKVLENTGQALVKTGKGESYLVDGLTAAPGDLVNLTVGNAGVLGTSAQSPLIGASVLAANQQTGSLLTVGAASGGQLLTVQPGATGVAAP